MTPARRREDLGGSCSEISLCVTAVAMLMANAGCRADRLQTRESSYIAGEIEILEGRNGDPVNRTVRLTHPSDVTQLMSFFPGAGTPRHPLVPVAGGWSARAEITVQRSDGTDIRVFTDYEDWNAEKTGDSRVRGDLWAFISRFPSTQQAATHERWTDAVAEVYLPDGTSAKLPARQTTYYFPIGGVRLRVVAMIIRDEKTGTVWGNRQMDCYMRMDARFIGVAQRGGGFWEFRDGLLPSSSMDFHTAEEEFDRAHGRMIEEPNRVVDFREPLPTDFFYRSPGSAATGAATVTKTQLHGHELQMDLTSPAGDYVANVGVDLKSLKVSRRWDDRRTGWDFTKGGG